MEQSNIKDERRFKLEKMQDKAYIPLFAGRPERQKIIQRDELINLKIALNSAKSLDEFLKLV